MKLVVAKTAGFCFGVRRAVRICEKAAMEQPGCMTLGPIIHNENVINELEHKGVRVISDISAVQAGDTVIIRSHGEGKAAFDALQARGAVIIDATCPDVKKIHDIVREESGKGRLPVIIGERSHAEVTAISGWCGENEIFETPAELENWLNTDDNADKPISLVSQTTNSRQLFDVCVQIVKKECTNGVVFDTICYATSQRQREAADISKYADAMIVVGGRNSANSLRLKDICKQHCSNVIFAESARDVIDADIRESDTVGVTAGASTPAWIIKEVIRVMSEEIILDRTADEQDTQDTQEINTLAEESNDIEAAAAVSAETDISSENAMQDETAAEQSTDNVSASDEQSTDAAVTPYEEQPHVSAAVSDEPYSSVEPADDGQEVKAQYDSVETSQSEVVESTQAEAVAEASVVSDSPYDQAEDDSDDSASEATETFEEMLEKSIKTLRTGERVSGVVTTITSTEVSVDLGAKQPGYIPINEFTDNNDAAIDDIIKVGDTIEAFVMRVNDVEGMVTLSKKRLDAIRNWDEIEAAKENNAIVEGTVTEENRGGIIVSVKGVNVFVPASLTGLPKTTPITELLKKTVRLRITEVNQSRRRVVGSIRAVQAEERREKAESVWNEIENGKKYDGVVKSMTSYGVFVDIGGVDGMIHISELSWTRIRQPSEVMSIGDEVTVYVLSFDKENRKISLGYRKSEDNPWSKFTSSYAVGDVTNVKIVKMMPFGAFAEICPGVDGLIHISQITDHRIGLPSEVLSDGQMVDVKITEIDDNRKKVSLSIRALMVPSSQPLTQVEIERALADDNTPVVVYDTDAPPPIDNDDEEEASSSDNNPVDIETADTETSIEATEAVDTPADDTPQDEISASADE